MSVEESGIDIGLDNVLEELGKSKIEGKEVLSKVLENPKFQKLLQIHKVLHKPLSHDKKDQYVTMCIEIASELKKFEDDNKCDELLQIMLKPHFRSLIEAYESINLETYSEENFLPKEDASNKGKGPPVRVVGLSKNDKEPLGVSLGRHDDGCIYIQRILRGTLVDRQGLFNVGDIIKEINGQPVGSDPDKVLQQMQSSGGGVTVKCIPVFKESRASKCQVFMRCHFEYSPNEDKDFPKGESGLSFQPGDILEIIDQTDSNWWQAKHIDVTKTGIVPSLKLQQSRKATNLIPKNKQNKILGKFQKKGKKKMVYQTCKNSIFDCFDVRLYEEVAKMPAIESKVIAFVGTQGLGKKSVITRLLNNYADRYVSVVPDTSREPREEEEQKKGYNFLKKDEMHKDILAGKYYEWGEDKGHFYGTKLSSIRDIINSGKIALVDCEASALKFLRTAEFMPFIVFFNAPDIQTLQKYNQQSNSKQSTREELNRIIEESADISDTYHHYFDKTIEGGNVEESYTSLREMIDTHSNMTHQWVPISWVY